MKILISGGGIAGLAVANILYRKGHQPIVIDRAREFSNSGFVLSLKSFGVQQETCSGKNRLLKTSMYFMLLAACNAGIPTGSDVSKHIAE